MTYMMHWEQPHPRTQNRIIRVIGAVVRAVTSNTRLHYKRRQRRLRLGSA